MKFLSWIFKTVMITVVIVSVSLSTTWAMVNIYVEQLFQQLNLKPADKKVALSEVVQSLIEPLNTNAPKVADRQRAQGEEEQKRNLSDQDPSFYDPYNQEPKGEDAVAVWNQITTGQNEQILSIEEFNRKKDMISNEDKMFIFSLMVSKVPQEDFQKLSLFLEDGVTEGELEQIQDILENRLSKEEFQQLFDILAKYE
jgi:hypothetical protein